MSRLVYGFRSVSELLQRGRTPIRELWVARDGRLHTLVTMAEQKQIRVQRFSFEDLDRYCPPGATHQGVVALVGDFEYLHLEDLLEPVGATPPLLLCVDSVTDPQNLGAMIRSAVVFGITDLVLPRDRCVGITPAVVRVASGATEHLRCAQVTNLSRALDQLKEHGVWVAGTVEQGGQAPADVDLCGPLALVVGNEERGMRPLVRKHCDLLLTIPVSGPIAALNVAAATAVVCYEVVRQRRARS